MRIAPRPIAAAILTLGGIASYALTYPGELEDDSFAQLVEARAESYSFWHPPVMSWMLGISDALSPGAAWFVAFQFLLCFGALVSLFWLGRRVSWGAVAGAFVILFLPQLFLFQATVWKDALFADACLAGFVCLMHAAVRWQSPRPRFALIGAAALFLALAMLARQNGVIMLPCAALALGLVATGRENSRRAGAIYGAVFAAGCAALALAGNAALELRADGTPAVEMQFKTLELYDIAGMAKARPHLALPILDQSAPGMARLIRGDGVRLYSPVKNDTLEASTALMDARDAVPAPLLARQWRSLLLHRPATYLAVRAKVFGWLFLPSQGEFCHPYHIGAEGNADDLRFLGMRPRLDDRDVALGDYAKALVATPVLAHPTYAILALLELALLLWRRRPADMVLAGLLGASLLFTLSFFVISIACDYRYLYVLDLSAIAAALYLLADFPKKKGGKSPLS